MDALVLARLLIRFRLRSFRNGLRARRGGGSPLLVAAIGLLISLAYVFLFAQAFGVIAETAARDGQVAALALVAGTLALGSLAAKAAGSEAVRAGSPENEFMLVRPVSLSALVTARGLADAVTDPVGALFLLPILVAASSVWRLGLVAWPVAVLTSMLIQVSISTLAYAAQLGVVRYVPAARRRVCWMGLRLFAGLALASLWMLGTWVLRAPAALAARLSDLAPVVALSPGALIAAPLAALARGEVGWAFAALGVLGMLAASSILLSATIARRAGLGGWEEAGALWADAAAVPRRRRAPSAATKDLLLIVRDRPQLLALIAMPILFVGVQIFGAAGWSWSTGSLARVSCLAYSLALYMATIGPLAHMQAERRAFWILRTVPVPLGRLLAAKARAWAVIVAATAALVFVPLSLAMPAVPGGAWLRAGLLVVGGAGAMTFLAVAMAASGADLSDEQRTAVGPGTIYSFLLVGGLYNVVLAGDLPRAAGLALYLFLIWATWLAGVERAEMCMDAEALAERRLRLVDGATLLVAYAFGARGVVKAARAIDGSGRAAAIAGIALLVLAGAAAGIILLRRTRGRPWSGIWRSVLIALGLGVALGAGVRGLGLAAPVAALTPSLVMVAMSAIAAEELLFRGVLQRYRSVRSWPGAACRHAWPGWPGEAPASCWPRWHRRCPATLSG